MKRAVVALDQDTIGKFQRAVDHEQNFARRTELDDRVLKKNAFVFAGTGIAVAMAVAISVAVADDGAAEFDGDPYRRGFGEKFG